MKPLTVGLLVLALTTPVLAKDGADSFAACHQDMQRLCKDVKPGEGRIMKCMMDNESRASAGCAALIAKKREKEAKRQ